MGPSADERKKIAEKGAATSRNVADKAEEVADQARRAGKENYLIAGESASRTRRQPLSSSPTLSTPKTYRRQRNCGRSTRSDSRSYGVGRLGK
jgi:hypothetical protein